MRDPKRIDTMLKLIEKIWKAHPDLRLMQLLQLIGNVVDNGDNYYLEDVMLEFKLRRIYQIGDPISSRPQDC